MIATLMSWPYGTFTKTKDRCLIMGFKEEAGGAVYAIVADLESGELSIVDIKSVTVDADKLRTLPL